MKKSFSLKSIFGGPSSHTKTEHSTTNHNIPSVSEEAVNVVLVQEVEKEERFVNFISWVLHDASACYQMIEKVDLTLVLTAQRIIVL